MSKIACAIICKNDDDADNLMRCLNSVAPFVDGVFIQVNGTPCVKIKDICRRYGANLDIRTGDFRKKIGQKEVKWLKKFLGYTPNLQAGDEIFQFSEARNANLAQISDEYNWMLWIDTDDVLRHGENLRQVVDEHYAINTEAIFLNYLYQVEFDERLNIKNILIQHLRERIVRVDKDYRKVFKWIGAIHETLIQQRETKKTPDNRMDILHLSSTERFKQAIQRNMKILELDVYNTQGKDPRPMYYLGKALYDLHTPQDGQRAEKLMLAYLSPNEHKNNMSGWREERAQCWEYLAEIYRERGDHNKSIKCLMNALIEYPQFSSIYLSLGLSHLLKGEWDTARFWAIIGSKVPPSESTLVSNPRDNEARAYEVIYNSSLNMGIADEAWAAAQKLKELFPNDPTIDEQWKFINTVKEQKEVFIKYMEIVNYLNATGQKEKIRPLLLAAPQSIADNPVLLGLYHELYPPKEWDKSEITIYCGPQFTVWGPKTLSEPKGSFVGGSEEAVILLSKELASLGWKVTVYADPGDQQGEHDGVVYKPFYHFNQKDNFNILIYWRAISYTDMKCEAKKTYIWCHDVQNPLDWTTERVDRLTKIICLSGAPRKQLPNIPDEKFFISSNGFTELTDEKPKNNPKWCVYTSSYDRGLQNLLEVWPDVVKEVPDAQLHIAYGWQLFKNFYKTNPERMAWLRKMEELMTAKGITHYERLPQPELEKLIKKCGLWTYPSHFYEINCISAIKAQAFGAVPIVTDFAALKETVQYGTKIEGEIYENVALAPETKEKYKKELIRALGDEKWQAEQRGKMTLWAKKYEWPKIAGEWNEEMKGGV